MSIKDDPELRHFLRHILYAITELALGHPKAALYELQSIQSMVSWGEDDDKFREFCAKQWKGGDHKWPRKAVKRKKAARTAAKRSVVHRKSKLTNRAQMAHR